MISISKRALECVWNAESECESAFAAIEEIENKNTMRVLNAFQNANVCSRHFAPTNGYGYDDIGRDTFDITFAEALGAESALVRPQIVNGTHALFLMLDGLSARGDSILSVTGKPYDTMEEAIGIRGNMPHSLKSKGVSFHSIELNEDGTIDSDTLIGLFEQKKYKICYFQRSRGYAWRPSISKSELKPIFTAIKAVCPECIIAVDNCYCEFVEEDEPVSYGADIMAGSLIKNPGGGIAPTGAYVAGRSDLIDSIAQRLTVPGIGGEVGSYAAGYRLYYQGLFMAPHTVAQCLKSAVLFSKVFEMLGYDTLPLATDHRSDIIQSIRFDTKDELIRFCQVIQQAAPIDSCVIPEPWNMPGYEHQVIMAAGAFVQGATTELSADAPIVEPYIGYLQGALTYAHGRIAALMAVDSLLNS